MISLEELWQEWQRFFHAPEPIAALCIFRVLFGIILVVNALSLMPFATDFFGPRGLLGTSGFGKAYPAPRLSLFYLLPATEAVAKGIVVLLAVSAACLAAGLFTPVAAPLTWLLLVSLHHRNPAIFNSGDTVQRLLMLLLCFTPSGNALSADCWLRGENAIAALRGSEFDPWAMRLMQIQICIVYLRSVYWKLKGDAWRKGTAVAYVLQAMSFRRYSAPQIMLHPIVYKSVTYSTMLLEIYIPICVWIRDLRWSAIVAGWLLHLALDTFLNVHLFGPTMCAALVLFVALN